MRIVGVGVGAPVSKSRSAGGPHVAARSKSSSLAAIAASHHASGGGSTGLAPAFLHSSTTSRNGRARPCLHPGRRPHNTGPLISGDCSTSPQTPREPPFVHRSLLADRADVIEKFGFDAEIVRLERTNLSGWRRWRLERRRVALLAASRLCAGRARGRAVSFVSRNESRVGPR
jgi:hypothetical protein